jgi:hypothetical protein
MAPSIIFKTNSIENHISLFQDFSSEFIDLQFKNLDHSRSDQNQLKELDFDLDWHDKLNETHQALSDFYLKNIQQDLEIEKNEILIKQFKNLGFNQFKRYTDILERKKNKLTRIKRHSNQTNIALLYLFGYDEIVICNSQNHECNAQIKHQLVSYLSEYFDGKIEEYELLFTSDSLRQLEDLGIQISKIVEEINDEKQLEFENELLNECWQIEYEVHLPIYNQERLDELINNEESDLSDFKFLRNKILWRSRDFEITDNESFLGHYFHPLKKDIQTEINKQITTEFKQLLSDLMQSDWFELNEIMEICDADYEIKIIHCEFPEVKLLTQLSVL